MRLQALDYEIEKEKQKEQKKYEIDADNGNNDDEITTYLKSVLGLFANREDSEHAFRVQDNARAVFIDTLGYGMMDFDLTQKDKELLFKSGEKAIDEYIDYLKSVKQSNV